MQVRLRQIVSRLHSYPDVSVCRAESLREPDGHFRRHSRLTVDETRKRGSDDAERLAPSVPDKAGVQGS